MSSTAVAAAGQPSVVVEDVERPAWVSSRWASGLVAAIVVARPAPGRTR
ncbi:hypothetical protein ACQPW1_23400 [Nocardia sp. CA-128927]